MYKRYIIENSSHGSFPVLFGTEGFLAREITVSCVNFEDLLAAMRAGSTVPLVNCLYDRSLETSFRNLLLSHDYVLTPVVDQRPLFKKGDVLYVISYYNRSVGNGYFVVDKAFYIVSL